MRTIQFKRGSEASRYNILLRNGEPFYATDTRILYIGDGVDYGGFRVTNIDIVTGGMSLISIQTITGIKIFKADSLRINRFRDSVGNPQSVITLTSGQQKFINTDNETIIDIPRYSLSGSVTDDGCSINWFNGNLQNINSIGLKTVDYNNNILSGNWQIANNTSPNNNSEGNIGILSISGDSLCLCTGYNQWGKLNLSTF